ncbi:helicase, partial [Fulvivirga sp. RKSG066]|uniref:helix-turn-helix domain-containing protein n=1 Tax=Fulvivirga aurantia TaxID=2529383 RepID=UPI0012BC24BA|nr:helicase [Fulvivirga aurantia]
MTQFESHTDTATQEVKLNETAALASKYINTTHRHIFLTGKAGTGKTTFLRHIMRHTYKKAAIAAPTGIAAINAGGVTLHSLLQLPFGVFVPDPNFTSSGSLSERVNTPRTVLSNYRINKTKRKLLQELELLIIDEVSMLRADLLDCIDTILRSIRKRRNIPFGGVQILFIGDLLQLPPVAKEVDQRVLSNYYNSNYFFAAKALDQAPPLFIELDKIYRQSDESFITVLNRFRDNKVTQADIDALNKHYKENFKPQSEDKYIQITTHNYKADAINKNELDQLKGKIYSYSASIQGDFPDSMYPVSDKLELKKGAQVMFLKNDSNEEKRYFNGKIGEVTHLADDNIEVTCEGEEPIVVESYEWENVRYTLDKETNEIDEKVIGRYQQYPLKLAWAVTVHKSQGLTFDRAILDLTDAFAAGQVYVALSRLTSLDGLVLSSPLSTNVLSSDEAINRFSANKKNHEALKQQLSTDRKAYIEQFAIESFNFYNLATLINKHLSSFDKADNLSVKQGYESWTRQLRKDIHDIKQVADTFINQIKKILISQGDYLPTLTERVNKAKEYFDSKLSEIRSGVKKHIDEVALKSKVKQYLKELEEIELAIYAKQQAVVKIDMLLLALSEGGELNKDQLQATDLYLSRKSEPKVSKKDKTPTHELSYKLYKEGNDIETIAEKRNLVPGTIAGHLCHYISTGDIDVLDFIAEDKLKNIVTVIDTIKTDKLGEVKSKLGEEYTYSDIKFAVAHHKFTSK